MKSIFSPFMRTYIFFFVCLLIVLMPVCVYTYRLSRDISLGEGERHLLTQAEMLRKDLNRMAALIQNIGTYETVIQSSMYRAPLSPVERYTLERARQMLANAVAALSNDVIADYGIVFRNGGCITAKRVFDSDMDCFGRFIQYQGDAESQWKNAAGLSSPGFYYTPEWGTFTGMIYAGDMPIRFVSYQSARVFFVLNTDVLLKQWKNQDIAYIEFQGIDGSVLAAQGTEKIGGYTISYSDIAGFRINAVIPQSVVLRKMQGDLIFIGVSIGIFLLIGLSLSLYLSYRNTKPLKDGLFERVLNGLVFTPKEWADLTILFKALPPVYCLCLIRGGGGDNFIEYNRSSVYTAVQDIMAFIAEHINFPKQIDFTGFVHYIGVDQAVAPLPICEAYAKPAAYQGILEKGMEIVEAKNRVRLHIAVSGVFHGIEQLSDAYRQVRQILRMVTVHTPGAVFLGDTAGKSPDRFPLEFTDSQRFYELLLAADFEHAAIMVHRAFAAMSGSCPAEPVVYHLFWTFEQVFIRIRAERILEEAEELVPPEYSATDTLEQMVEKILNSAEELCLRIDRAHKQKEAALTASLMASIDRNLSNPMLCLAGVASEFGLSETSTGKLVKKHTGKSFFEYVDQNRMKKAYALLAESEMPVNDVAQKCGFALVNSFYKSFKRHFGFPPTVLRQTAKQDSPGT